MYFLDSDTCIEIMRGKLPYAFEFMKASTPDAFAIPAIVEAELRYGARNSSNPEEGAFLLERFLEPFDGRCAEAYGVIRHALKCKGQMIGPNDLLIAATALAHGATLVTNNVREFVRVEGLSLESWAVVEFEG